jgi:hypothetical protein
MAFDFKNAQAQAKKQMNNKALFSIILGASGSGKSSLIGTAPGKVLFVFGSGEGHGPKAAAALGGDIVPICMDVGDDGTQLSPDAARLRLLDILGDVTAIKAEKFSTVALDGAPEVEAIFLQSQRFINAVTTDKGKVNTYAKPGEMSILVREVVMALKRLHSEGLNVLVTCRTDVKSLEDNGAVSECMPKLSSYGVAENLISQFDDVLMVGAMSIGGKQGFALQFGAAVSRVSKTEEGVVKKILNFSPRITGAKDVPEYMKADLKKVIELKSGTVKEEKK